MKFNVLKEDTRREFTVTTEINGGEYYSTTQILANNLKYLPADDEISGIRSVEADGVVITFDERIVEDEI